MPLRKSRKKKATIYKNNCKSRDNCMYIKIKVCKSRRRSKKIKSRRSKRRSKRSIRSRRRSRRRSRKRSRRRSRKQSRRRSRRRSKRRLKHARKHTRKRSRNYRYSLNDSGQSNYSYLFNRKRKSNCVTEFGCPLCSNIAVFSRDFIEKVVPYITKSDEISGILKIHTNTKRNIDYLSGENSTISQCKKGCNSVYEITLKKINDGNGENADMITARAGVHTHPEKAYLNHNCDLGWPSKDDYITFLETFLGYNTVLHIVCALEGFYVITIPAKTVQIMESLSANDARELLFDAVKKFINIDKNGYKMSDGRNNVHDPISYQNFINTFKFPKDKTVPDKLVGKQPFRIDFISYENMGVKTYILPDSKLNVYKTYGCPYNPDTNKVEFKNNNKAGIRFSYASIDNKCDLNDL